MTVPNDRDAGRPTALLAEQRHLAGELHRIEALDDPSKRDLEDYEAGVTRFVDIAVELDGWISRGGALPAQWQTQAAQEHSVSRSELISALTTVETEWLNEQTGSSGQFTIKAVLEKIAITLGYKPPEGSAS